MQTIANAAGINSLMCLPKHGGAIEILVTHLIALRQTIYGVLGFFNFFNDTYIRTTNALAEKSQIHRDTYILPKLLGCEKYCRRDRWQAHRHQIAAHLRCPVYLFIIGYD
jgi:hypothetical protein